MGHTCFTIMIDVHDDHHHLDDFDYTYDHDHLKKTKIGRNFASSTSMVDCDRVLDYVNPS